MKVREVPQDQDPTFEGGSKVCYAVGPDGKFVPVKTSGWEVEALAKDLAWKAIGAELESCKQRIRSAQASPLEYFMKWRQMDVGLLAANMGLCSWQVRWHLRPRKFRKLNEQWLSRYAKCLDIQIEQLRTYAGE